MSETTLIRPNRHQASAERRTTAERKVWDEVGDIMTDRIGTAVAGLRDRGYERPTPSEAISAAYAIQRAEVDATDTDAMSTLEVTSNYAALTLLQMPAAERARRDLDEKKARGLYGKDTVTERATLCQFNHDLAETLTYMPPSMAEQFPDVLYGRAQKGLAGRFGLDILRRPDFDRMVTGMKYEVATARALKVELPDGWSSRGATVQEDLEGIDLIVIDPDGDDLLVDTKGGGKFAKLLDEYASSDRMSQAEVELAREAGHFRDPGNPHTGQKGQNIIVNANHLGSIKGFDYEDTEYVGSYFMKLMQQQKALLL